MVFFKLIFFGLMTSLSFAPLYFFITVIAGVGLFYLELEKINSNLILNNLDNNLYNADNLAKNNSKINNNTKKYITSNIYLAGYYYGIGYYLGTLYWVGISAQYQEYFYVKYISITFLLSSFLALFFILFVFFYRTLDLILKKIFKINLTIIAFSFAWFLIEYLRTFIPFEGFPWGLISHAFWFSLESLQILSIVGDVGAGFIVCFIATLLASSFTKFNSQKKINISFAVLLIIGIYIYGAVRLKNNKIILRDNIEINLIQANQAEVENLHELEEKYTTYTNSDEFKEINEYTYSANAYEKASEYIKKRNTILNAIYIQKQRIENFLISKIEKNKINIVGEDGIDNLNEIIDQYKYYKNQNGNVKFSSLDKSTIQHLNRILSNDDLSYIYNVDDHDQNLQKQNDKTFLFTCKPTGIKAPYNTMQFTSLNPDYSGGYYSKMHLVPFGEYLPDILFCKYIPNFISSLLVELSMDNIYFTKGKSDSVYEVGSDFIYLNNIRTASSEDKMQNLLFFPTICFESIFSAELRQRYINIKDYISRNTGKKNNPNDKNKSFDAIVNCTNDSWYKDSSGPYQHLQSARMRAIELGLPVIRAAKTGISAVIAPNGEIIDSIPFGISGSKTVLLPMYFSETIYIKYKYAQEIAILLLSLIFILISYIAKFFMRSKINIDNIKKNIKE